MFYSFRKVSMTSFIASFFLVETSLLLPFSLWPGSSGSLLISLLDVLMLEKLTQPSLLIYATDSIVFVSLWIFSTTLFILWLGYSLALLHIFFHNTVSIVFREHLIYMVVAVLCSLQFCVCLF